MDEQIKIWLYDILTAIEEIESFLGDGPKRFADYHADIRTRRAVERNVAIMGEAMNRILKINPGFTITAARRIVDTRNRIVHGYDSVSDETMWGIVINHLPLLKAEIERLLGEQ
ncbi:MAG: DUF86 domain-containing protein [Culturomica sp.]|jgi:uncharacterized protein with HEPN domain|nr:DUF86 domain-containing protein [Culturomica sp.]